ncbi:hypothetical protein G6F66_009525 [Rhizopus arrhizus]|nr:hypothetical protein G6F66_009525 [Rhizopus arrhizus]
MSFEVRTFEQEVSPGHVLKMPNDGTGLSVIDPYLAPFNDALRERFATFQKYDEQIKNTLGYDAFTRGYEYYGFNILKNNSVVYREWAPHAVTASLVGDFNNWDVNAHVMTRNQYGVFEILVEPTQDGKVAIPHGSKIKVKIVC